MRCRMNLIYSDNYSTARTFALAQELAPGDWKWINESRVLRDKLRGGRGILIARRACCGRGGVGMLRRRLRPLAVGTLHQFGKGTADRRDRFGGWLGVVLRRGGAGSGNKRCRGRLPRCVRADLG